MAKQAALATIVLALIGLAISGTIGSVHRNLTASPGYTSFCTINESVNCDVVLSSDYAYFAGVPVAWWAGLTYVLFAVGGMVAIRSPRATRRRQASTALFAGAVWSLIYSLFLAGIAFMKLRAVCLLCGGLYVVNAALFVSTWLLLAAVRAEGPGAARVGDLWKGRTRLIAVGAMVAIVAFLGLALREASRDLGHLSAEEVAELDPEFHRWYTALPVASAQLSGGHAMGDPASVVIVEFSDFECGHCAKANRSLKRVLPRFGNDVQLVFRHFPLDATCNPGVTGSFHRYACLAAAASECAALQGRFWEYHDLLFEHQSVLDRDSLVRYAERLDLDRQEFLACLDSDMALQAVRRDAREAVDLGVTSTPTFFLNGRKVKGALDSEKFAHAIRLERAALRPGG